MFLSLDRERRFWNAHVSEEQQRGFWEKEGMGNWLRINQRVSCEEYLDSRYVETFRLDYTTFHWLLSQVEGVIQRQDTRFRNALPAAKKLAITMQWLAQGSTFGQLANEYFIGKSTAHETVHGVV